MSRCISALVVGMADHPQEDRGSGRTHVGGFARGDNAVARQYVPRPSATSWFDSVAIYVIEQGPAHALSQSRFNVGYLTMRVQ